MSYGRRFPHPWTPMHTNVPMLGTPMSGPCAAPANVCRNRMLIGGAVLVGLVAAFALALKPVRNPKAYNEARSLARLLKRAGVSRASAERRIAEKYTVAIARSVVRASWGPA